MKVVFRVDASDSIASGHVIRCLTLARVLRGRGVECIFISREGAGNLLDSVVSAGFEQRVLPGPDEFSPPKATVTAGQLSAQEDAHATVAAISGEDPAWIVVDHYAISEEWESLVRPHVGRILVIDDLADRGHECDVLVDQNFSVLGSQRYTGLIQGETRLLCGPRYALLQPEFVHQRHLLDRQRSTSLRAFVSFGGSDRDNLTGLVLDAFESPELDGIALDVAIGRKNPHSAVLQQRIGERPLSRAHFAPTSLADLMARADFAIGGGGTTTWERLCLDLPSVVVALADNQVQTCESLALAGRIDYAGYWTDITPSTIRAAVIRLSTAVGGFEADAMLPLVDGRGAERVAELMAPTAIENVILRPAAPNDIDSYFSWVNDTQVRRQSLTTDEVSWPDHRRWFRNKIRDPNSVMNVLEVQGLPVGQIRFDCKDGTALLDYSLDTLVRGRGLGERLLRLGIQQLAVHGPLTVVAKVRKANSASAHTVSRLGFVQLETADQRDVDTYVLDI